MVDRFEKDFLDNDIFTSESTELYTSQEKLALYYKKRRQNRNFIKIMVFSSIIFLFVLILFALFYSYITSTSSSNLSKLFPQEESIYFTEEEHRLLSRKYATEGMVLAQNPGILPILPYDKVVLFGQGTIKTIYGGGGSAGVYQKGERKEVVPVSMLEGIENKIKEKRCFYIKNIKGYLLGKTSFLQESDIIEYAFINRTSNITNKTDFGFNLNLSHFNESIQTDVNVADRNDTNETILPNIPNIKNETEKNITSEENETKKEEKEDKNSTLNKTEEKEKNDTEIKENNIKKINEFINKNDSDLLEEDEEKKKKKKEKERPKKNEEDNYKIINKEDSDLLEEGEGDNKKRKQKEKSKKNEENEYKIINKEDLDLLEEDEGDKKKGVSGKKDKKKEGENVYKIINKEDSDILDDEGNNKNKKKDQKTFRKLQDIVPINPLTTFYNQLNNSKENNISTEYFNNNTFNISENNLNMTNNTTNTTIPEKIYLEPERSLAILTISRISREGVDRNLEEDIHFTEEEIQTYVSLRNNFDAVVIVLNVPSMIEIDEKILNDTKTAILIAFLPGIEAGNAIADVLFGDVNPSGHLTDTWAKKINDYPTTESFLADKEVVKYDEGIFVGYRYFESNQSTWDRIAFPFGHGLSYTQFLIKSKGTYDKDKKILTVSSNVKNIGDRRGRQVVQVYGEKQQNEKFIKANRELIGFAKTKELAPGEEQELKMEIRLEDLASYDEDGIIGNKGCYVIEKGTYNIYVGTSVAETRNKKNIVYTFDITSSIITRILNNRLQRNVTDEVPKKPSYMSYYLYNYTFENYNFLNNDTINYNEYNNNTNFTNINMKQSIIDEYMFIQENLPSPNDLSLINPNFEFMLTGILPKKTEINETLPNNETLPSINGTIVINGTEITVLNNGTLIINGTVLNNFLLINGTIVSTGSLTTRNTFINNEKALNNGPIVTKGTALNNEAVLNNGTNLNNETVLNNGSLINNGSIINNGSVSNNKSLEIKETLKSKAEVEEIIINRINFKSVLLGRYSMRDLVRSMSDEELAFLTYGHQYKTYITGSIGNLQSEDLLKQYLIPTAETQDGPSGLRQINKTMASVAWPCPTLLASSFDTELLQQMGEETGKEARKVGAHIWLAPALNIHRNPLCGRNFEYYSEDPFLSGKMAAAVTRGIQSKRVSATLKHFAANNKEDNRMGDIKNRLLPSDSQMSERTAREIYLKGFEIAINEGKPWSIMTSYNRLNGIQASANKDLLTYILRNEWGYEGMIMTDWGVFSDLLDELKAGGNVKMPSNNEMKSYMIMSEIKNEKFTRKQLEDACFYTLNTIAKTFAIDNLFEKEIKEFNLLKETRDLTNITELIQLLYVINIANCTNLNMTNLMSLVNITDISNINRTNLMKLINITNTINITSYNITDLMNFVNLTNTANITKITINEDLMNSVNQTNVTNINMTDILNLVNQTNNENITVINITDLMNIVNLTFIANTTTVNVINMMNLINITNIVNISNLTNITDFINYVNTTNLTDIVISKNSLNMQNYTNIANLGNITDLLNFINRINVRNNPNTNNSSEMFNYSNISDTRKTT